MHKAKFVKAMNRRINNGMGKLSQKVSEGLKPEDDVELNTSLVENKSTGLSIPEPPRFRFGAPQNNPPASVKLLVIGCVLFSMNLHNQAFAQSCMNGLTVTATSTTCVNIGNLIENCTVSFDSLITIPVVGGSACVQFNTLDGKPLASGFITYNSMLSKIPLVTSYYTSTWTLFGQSARRCSGDGNCPTDCATVAAGSSRSATGIFSDPRLVSQPGVTTCSRNAACWGNGCFSCDNDCLYSGYGINPLGQVYTVNSLGSEIRTASITLNISSNALTFFGNAAVGTSEVIDSTGQFGLTFIGTLAGQGSNFGTDSIIVANGYAYKGPASAAQAPVAGTIGDIQANTAASLFSQTQNAFIFPSTMVTLTNLKDSVVFNYPAPGINNILLIVPMPQTIGSNIYKYDLTSNSVMSNLTFPGPAVFKFRTPSTVTISRIRNIVCPIAVIADKDLVGRPSAVGCRNCPQGVIVRINAYSSCASGIVLVSSSDTIITVQTPSLLLTTTNQLLNVTISVPDNQRCSVLYLKGDTETAILNFCYTAYDIITVGNQTNIGFITNPHDFPVSGNPFYDFFTQTIPQFFDNFVKGLYDWWVYLVAAIIGLILLIPLIWGITKCIRGSSFMAKKGYEGYGTIKKSLKIN